MTWIGSNIVVFNDVTIKPPYRVEDIVGNTDSRQFVYVKKMVERLTQDYQANVTTAKNSISRMHSQPPLPQRKMSAGHGPSNASHAFSATKPVVANSNAK